MVFYQVGTLINKLKWPIIVMWVLVFLLCIPTMSHIMDPFKTTGFVDNNSASTHAQQTMDHQLGYKNNNSFIIMYHSATLHADQDVFLAKIKKSLSGLKDFPIPYKLLLPYQKQQISHDKHTAYVIVVFKSKHTLDATLLAQFKHSIKKPLDLNIQFGGEPLFVENVTEQTQTDLYKADLIATPVSIITLLLVFGSVTAALLPIILGGACAIIILNTLYYIGHYCTLSVFTINIALLLGLCLCLDYSLFYISRFRDELHNGLNATEALAVTQAHAGKAIFFSGLAVFASLSALFLFPINILFSVAVGGLAAVFFAVLTTTILLPAILAILKEQINFLSIRKHKSTSNRFSCWRWLAKKVVYRPYLFFFTILIFLSLLGYPFSSALFGVSDYHIFPKQSPSRSFYDNFAQAFNEQDLNSIKLIISSKSAILEKNNLTKIYKVVHQLQDNVRIKKINGIISSHSKFSVEQYYQLYHNEKSLADNHIKNLLALSSSEHITVLDIISKYSMNSPQTKKLIIELRQFKAPKGLTIQFAGTSVANYDVMYSIKHMLPYAILWIMVFSYLILLVLLRSIFLPFKAILMNLLSLCASYGALVYVFQEGYFAHLLNFEVQGMLDISLLVIIFCALFGFSMDYEVFLLTRIKEAYENSRDNNKSIIFGIEKSSRIITSAALIVIVLCCSFLVADVLMVKAFGLGIAVAIFMDAFLIRSFLVPATMALFNSWNWYLPRCLERLLPKL